MKSSACPLLHVTPPSGLTPLLKGNLLQKAPSFYDFQGVLHCFVTLIHFLKHLIYFWTNIIFLFIILFASGRNEPTLPSQNFEKIKTSGKMPLFNKFRICHDGICLD